MYLDFQWALPASYPGYSKNFVTGVKRLEHDVLYSVHIKDVWSSTCTPQYILISGILATLPSDIQQHWQCTKHKSARGDHTESWNIYRIKGTPSWVTSNGMSSYCFIKTKHTSNTFSAHMYLLSETSQKHHLDPITHIRLQMGIKKYSHTFLWKNLLSHNAFKTDT